MHSSMLVKTLRHQHTAGRLSEVSIKLISTYSNPLILRKIVGKRPVLLQVFWSAKSDSHGLIENVWKVPASARKARRRQ